MEEIMLYSNIKTDRLLLKNIGYEDRDFVLKQFSDADVNQFLFDAEPLASLADADELIEYYLQGGQTLQHRWIIVCQENGEKIGTCGFHCFDAAHRAIDIGYDLQRAYWGKGIMTEAITAMLSEYLPQLPVECAFAHIAAGNVRSEKLAQRFGFIPSGQTETLYFHNQAFLHNIYVLHIAKTNGTLPLES